MKKPFLILIASLLIGITAMANNYNRQNSTPFVFVENNIEYAVFSNGEFDFNMIQPQRNQVHISNRNIHLSFNSGHNYNTYIHKNQYGDIININHTPIFYDRSGRVQQIGNINIRYNRFGYIHSIGQLNINYNTNGQYYCTGYVNTSNRYYQPRFRSYVKPTRHHHAYVAPKRYTTSRTYYGTTNRTYSNNQSICTTSTNNTRYSTKQRATKNVRSNQFKQTIKSSPKYSYQNNNTRRVSKI